MRPSTEKQELHCDLIVIGRGMCGMSATLFARQAGLEVIQVGQADTMRFASGYFDLLGSDPFSPPHTLEDPWTGLKNLSKTEPAHPLSRTDPADICKAFTDLFAFLKKNNLPYHAEAEKNSPVLSPLGTFKMSYGLPQSMWAGTKLAIEKKPCLFIDFKTYKDFCAELLVTNLKTQWPGLRSLSIDLPSSITPATEIIAQHFDRPEIWQELAEAVRPALGQCQGVGLPAILGLTRTTEALTFLSRKLGTTVFEIPTAGTSIPGIRLINSFESGFSRLGIASLKCRAVQVEGNRQQLKTTIADSDYVSAIRSKGIILATGRFLGQGLTGQRTGIREPLCNLPLDQPAAREQWHKREFFHPTGHPINKAGIITDQDFRPVDKTGQIVDPRIFAAGSILAGQDWKRQKCGTGLAVATAWGAVKGFLDSIR